MNTTRSTRPATALLFLLIFGTAVLPCPAAALWDTARAHASVHRFSTLFTAQDVRGSLGSPAGIDTAMAWCRTNGITRVYLEVFRDGEQADASVLATARDRFRQSGFLISGCVTPTHLGKPSSRWNTLACYTDAGTQERVQRVFEQAAALFDEVMIDDFWFTDCECAECTTARTRRRVDVAGRITTPAGDSWEDYRRELMLRVSAERVLAPARRTNSRVRLIVKYPQWYDMFHERGYDVDRETRLFDRIWVGTETRDYTDPKWGGTVQYEAYFLMRWLGGIGAAKCGGGWYDWLGTTEATYVEQARQTVLAGAHESMLFCYGGLQGTTEPRDVEALRAALPELLATADQVSRRRPTGIAAYKPPNSHPGDEKRVFDFMGMAGIPLAPCHEFPSDAPAAFFSVHALKDPEFPSKLARYVRTGKPVLLTDGLMLGLAGRMRLDAPNVFILPVHGDPKSLLTLGQETLDGIRAPLLRPFKCRFSAPNRVALYLFRDGSRVVENFNDQPVDVNLDGNTRQIPARGWWQAWQ